MEIQELESFVNVVQQGSFSKAAKSSGYSQAAVTIHIKNLEDELHLKLFDRLGRKISLTSSGKLFYQHAVRILNTMTEAKKALDPMGELCGILSIGASGSLCSSFLGNLVQQYHDNYPQVKLQIVTDTDSELEKQLNNNNIDLLFLAGKSKNNSNWNRVLNQKEPVLFAVSPKHPLAGKSIQNVKTLLSFPFILTGKDSSYRQLLNSALTKLGIELHPFLECTDTNLILTMIRRNEGITFLPEYVVREDIAAHTIVPLSVADFRQNVCLQLFHHKDKWITREMHAFIELTQQICKTG